MPSSRESSMRTSKQVKKGKNMPPPLSIEDIVNDIVHNRNYNTIKSRYARFSKEEKKTSDKCSTIKFKNI